MDTKKNMTDSIATLIQEGNISIIKLDDGKANAFSYAMLAKVNELLAEAPRDSRPLFIINFFIRSIKRLIFVNINKKLIQCING